MGQDLTIIAEYYNGQWYLADPMQPTGLSAPIPPYLLAIDGYVEKYGHLFSQVPVITHEPVNLWGGRNTNLQSLLQNATKHHGLPDDCSTELRVYIETHVVNCGYGLGWMTERQLPRKIKRWINLNPTILIVS